MGGKPDGYLQSVVLDLKRSGYHETNPNGVSRTCTNTPDYKSGSLANRPVGLLILLKEVFIHILLGS